MPRTQPNTSFYRNPGHIDLGKRRTGAQAPVLLTAKTLFMPQVFG